jgi:hypothetical protein
LAKLGSHSSYSSVGKSESFHIGFII